MNAENIAACAQLVTPLEPEQDQGAHRYAWFRGTVEQAQQAQLLQQHGVPGEGGRPKSFTVTVDGRKVNVWRYTKRLVRVCFSSTKAEERAEVEAVQQLGAEREALKQAAVLDAQAAALAASAALQPKTGEEFAKAAEDALWRAYCGFCLAFIDDMHPSGFYFDQLVKDEVRGHIHSAIWAIRDAAVLHDADKLQKPIQDLRHKASKLDAPLQRFLASVKDVPVDQQELRDE